ncbi:hypothetical protein CBER1_10980 [Cercospora berteroae]|uniref:Phosphoribulokinase/uridine kinase domain-containing protein n=1 Tax=Cercospora berteroae TaxID=357750 RepID=A0A2S6BZE8_9PEZI|nr:hypothetical protein CBER1_10980 [Cercospora berteroae]
MPITRGDKKAILVGISGVSSSGKTTLARTLRDIFPRAFILHEDDFYKTDEQIPIHPEHQIADWDCLESINLPAFEKALKHIRDNGLSPPDFTSKEDTNSVGEVEVDGALIEDLKWKASKWMFADAPSIAIIDGFLLYSEGMKQVRDLFDVKLFLRTDYQTAKARREARTGYVTLEGFWEDPPGYVDKIVWPNYVKDHAFMFKDGNVEGTLDDRVLRELDIKAVPDDTPADMTSFVQWAYDVFEEALQEFTMPRD